MPARWSRSGRSRPSTTLPGRIVCRVITSSRLRKYRAMLRRVYRAARRWRRWSNWPHCTCPTAIGYEWTDLSYEQKQAGNMAIYVFGASVLFVFMVLAAQYESWSQPLSVILIVPMCLLAAVSGLLFRGMSIDILAQISFVVLVALASKNAILIVEFAKQAEDAGETVRNAAVQAARTRLRPILMTSLAFILGVVPLAVATGAGAEMRQSLGTAVVFGILGVTLVGLIFTPTFYTVVRQVLGKASPQKPGLDYPGRLSGRV